MAAIRTNEKRTASIIVDNGVSSAGKALTKSISFSGVNPSAGPAALLAGLEALGSLMDKTVQEYVVTDKDAITEE